MTLILCLGKRYYGTDSHAFWRRNVYAETLEQGKLPLLDFDSTNQHDHGHGIVPNYTTKTASRSNSKGHSGWFGLSKWLLLWNCMQKQS